MVVKLFTIMKNKRFTSLILGASFFISTAFAQPKNADKPMPSGPKPKDRPSVALVLAGGGAKGFAHLPVMELIEEVGIPIDMIVGSRSHLKVHDHKIFLHN
jgi:NTE family protein